MEPTFSQWMDGNGPESDIVISSRVRLARNFAEFPFPHRLTPEQAEALWGKVRNVLQGLGDGWGFRWMPIKDLSGLDRQVLVEKHLVSPQLVEDPVRFEAVSVDRRESLSIMVNEEDHLRIQALLPGLQLDQAWQLTSQLDDLLEAKEDFAFDPHLGYLTACPTNLGTALRASVMMHLPALVLTRQLPQVFTALAHVGVVVRGLYGEGSEPDGNIFQVSNQVSLGLGEEEFVHNLTMVTQQLVGRERHARQELLNAAELMLEDRVARALGILTHARILSSEEALRLLSDVKLGADLGLISPSTEATFGQLVVMTRPGLIQFQEHRELSPLERDQFRAKLLRRYLAPQPA